MNFNHLFERHDQVIYERYDSLSATFFMLLSSFMQPEFFTKLTVGKLTKFDQENSENYLSSDSIFIGIGRKFLRLQFGWLGYKP